MKKKTNQKPMNVSVKFSNVKPDEETPKIALYEMGARGKAIEKIAVVEKGGFRISPELAKIEKALAIGPDVEKLDDLENNQLLQFEAARAVPEWLRAGQIEIARPDWILWPYLYTCVSGRAYKCNYFWPILPPIIPPTVRAIRPPFSASLAPVSNLQIGQTISPFFYRCYPLCYGRVEVYRRVCCCIPWDIVNENEVEIKWPDIPIGPGPYVNLDEIRQAKILNASVEPAERVIWEERTIKGLNTYQALPTKEAKVSFLQDNLYLIPVLCFGRINCTTTKLGEAFLGPDGSFTHCFFNFPVASNCTVTYFYKVKQWIGGQWVYVYNGEASQAYFSANEPARLSTYDRRAETCYSPEPPTAGKGRPFAMLQSIGTTDSHRIKSPQQNSATGLQTLLSSNAGLLNPTHHLYDNAPLGGTLQLSLYFDPDMHTLGARYYRLSLVRANGVTGNPSGSILQLTDNVSWRRFIPNTSPQEIVSEALGPQTVGNQSNLYKIPYFTFTDRLLNNQYHYLLDTTKFSNGKYLLRLEIFNQNGVKMKPIGSGTGASNFHFLKWENANTFNEVPFENLLHILHIDNLHCFADIEGLRNNGVSSNANCQFLSGRKESQFSVDFRAYHQNDFMWQYRLTYFKGLNGNVKSFQEGTTNQPATKNAGSAAVSNSKMFGEMLDGDEKCSFAIELRAYAKHTNGRSRIHAYDDIEKAAFALERTDI